MQYRTFGRMVGRLARSARHVGNGWLTGSNDDESIRALPPLDGVGYNGFDTAWGCGEGHRRNRCSGKLLRAHPDKKLYTACQAPLRVQDGEN